MNKLSLSLIAMSISVMAHAQEKVEMADLLRSNGKIYTVVAVILTILAGLFVYLISIDRKISKLEKESKNPHT